MMRTYDQIKSEVQTLIRGLIKGGVPRHVIFKSVRFYVTQEEVDMVDETMSGRGTTSGTLPMTPGYYIGFFGLRFTTSEGEYYYHGR